MNFDQVSPRSMEFLAKVAETPEDQFEEVTLSFIGDREASGLVVPDFDVGCEWLNTSERLSFETNLKDKLCVMDFFTYCCINCMHVLPRKFYYYKLLFYIDDMIADVVVVVVVVVMIVGVFVTVVVVGVFVLYKGLDGITMHFTFVSLV